MLFSLAVVQAYDFRQASEHVFASFCLDRNTLPQQAHVGKYTMQNFGGTFDGGKTRDFTCPLSAKAQAREQYFAAFLFPTRRRNVFPHNSQV